MINNYSALLFNAASYNPLFTVVGLLLGAVGLGVGYKAVQILNGYSPGKSSNSRITDIIAGLVLLGGAFFVLGLAVICAMWVAG